jgi:plastocyanin
VLLCALAACSEAEETDEVERDSTVSTIPNAPVAADTLRPGQVADIAVVLDEWSITIPTDTLAGGQTQFTVVNRGEFMHGLEVEGQGIEEKLENIRPGDQATITVNLPPGAYELYCPVQDTHGNHKTKGMTRKVIVR